MAFDDLIVGLDIGTTYVRAVIGEIDENNQLSITGVGTSVSSGLRRGVVINIESTLKAVSDAVESAELMSGREVGHVLTGIAGGHIESLNSRGVVAVTGKDREINQHDVNRVLDAARAIVIPMDREILHAIPQEFIVDDQGGIKDPIDMIGVRLEAEVHIITGSVTSSQNLVKCINRAGFKVQGVVLDSLAAGRAVLTEDEKELGVLLIDLGGGTTDITLHVDGSPYFTHVIPVGGAQVTADLSIMLETPFDAAEKIKVNSGCCFQSMISELNEVILPGVGGRPPLSVRQKDICGIIQPRMAEIFAMVRKEVEKNNYLKQIGGGVVLTGGGAKLPGAVELASQIFGKAARIGRPIGLGGLVEEYNEPDFATAAGLVLYGATTVGTRSEQGSSKGSTSWVSSLGQWIKNFFD